MIAPALAYIIINNFIPMAGLVVAFKHLNYSKGIWGSDWVGLKNFKFLFVSSDAWIITRNTILYNLAFIIIGTLFAIMVAIFLTDLRNRYFSKVSQSIIIIPALVSWVVVSTLVYSGLSTESGLLNKILGLFGSPHISWYSLPSAWPIILLLVYLWKNAGFQCVIFMASILSFNTELYEAARIDGASKWQQIRHLTIPMLKPTIIMIVLLSLGKIFYSDFGLFYQVPLNSGALFSTTSTIDTYVFNGLVKLGNLGMTAAAGFYQSIVGFVLILVSNLVVRKISPENALF